MAVKILSAPAEAEIGEPPPLEKSNVIQITPPAGMAATGAYQAYQLREIEMKRLTALGFNVRAIVVRKSSVQWEMYEPNNWGVMTKWCLPTSQEQKYIGVLWFKYGIVTFHNGDELIVIHKPIDHSSMDKLFKP